MSNNQLFQTNTHEAVASLRAGIRVMIQGGGMMVTTSSADKATAFLNKQPCATDRHVDRLLRRLSDATCRELLQAIMQARADYRREQGGSNA